MLPSARRADVAVSPGTVGAVLGAVVNPLELTLNRAEHFLLSVWGWDIEAVARLLPNLYSFWI